MANFTIRMMNATDADLFYDVIEKNRKRLESFFSGTVARTRTRKDAHQYVAEIMEKIEDKKYFPYLVLNGDTVAGFVDVKNIDWNIPKGELGCFLDGDYAGKGTATEMLKSVVDNLFAGMKFHKLFLRTHPGNTAACKLAENCGFEQEGIIRADYRTTDGELVDLVYYGLLNPNR